MERFASFVPLLDELMRERGTSAPTAETEIAKRVEDGGTSKALSAADGR